MSTLYCCTGSCLPCSETPLVVAIRAGQASAVELLAKRGAALDGGRSAGRLTSSDGRAPAGAREKMMARRHVGRSLGLPFHVVVAV